MLSELLLMYFLIASSRNLINDLRDKGCYTLGLQFKSIFLVKCIVGFEIRTFRGYISGLITQFAIL